MLEEKNVLKFDPSFEKSLFGVQDSSKWEMTKTLHVNPSSDAADDKGPGTAHRPLKTVARAVEMIKPGTRVLIYPGVYRESITLQKTKTLDQSGTEQSPIVIEAKDPGTVIFSGSEVWTNWNSEGNGVYSAAWPYKWGTNPWMGGRSKPIGRRFELVFIDGKLLKQVLERKEMKPGTYCADETAEKLYIWLKDSARPEDHKIEVSVRGGLEHGAGLTVGHMWDVERLPSYIAVKGLISNTCYLTIEGNTFFGNKKEQIGNWHRGPRRRSLEGDYRTVGLKVIGNHFVATDPEQFLIRLPGFDCISETATFKNNIYYQSGHQPLFEFGERMGFEQWKTIMKETGSMVADPMFRGPEILDSTPPAG